jgi:phage gp29-like protein
MIDRLKHINKFREQLNPLRGLTIARAVSLLEANQRGEHADCQWCFKFVEESDADLFTLVERRTSAVLEMDWNIHVKTESKSGKQLDQKLAGAQREALAELYDDLDNLYEAVEHLCLSTFRGFAHLEKHRDADGRVKHLEPLDQWNVVRDGMYGQWKYNPRAASASFTSLPDSDTLDPEEWIVRENRRFVNRIGLIKFIRANLSQKDWDSYVEIYGIPAAFIIGPENVPVDQADEYRVAAERAAEGGSGYIPNGGQVEFANEARGVQPFQKHLEWIQKQLVLAGTGGLLTMLAESGSGTLAGGAHMQAFETIAKAEARRISELLQEQLSLPFLRENFPGQPELAYFQLASQEETDVGEIVEHVSKLYQAGYQVDAEELSEKTGYKLAPAAVPATIGETIQPARPAMAAENKEMESVAAAELVARARMEYAGAVQADFAGLAKRLNRLYGAAETMAPEDLQAALEELQADLPGYLPDDPEAAGTIARAVSAEFFNGIDDAKKEAANA